MEENRNNIWMLRLYILILVIGLTLIFIALGDFWCLLASPVDLHDLEPEKIKSGLHVTMELNSAVDYYASETKKVKKYGITSDTNEDTARYYIVPIVQGEGEADKYVTFKINANNYDNFDTMTYQSEAIFNGSYDYNSEFVTCMIEGRVKKTSRSLKSATEAFFMKDLGKHYCDEGRYVASNNLPYMVVPINKALTMFLMIFGSVLVLVSAVFILIATKKNKLTKMTYGAHDSNIGLYGTKVTKQVKTVSEEERKQMISQYIHINEIAFKKTELIPINDLIKQGRKKEAKEALLKLGGLEEDTVEQVINNWNVIYKV